jgi:hypothetical protein
MLQFMRLGLFYVKSLAKYICPILNTYQLEWKMTYYSCLYMQIGAYHESFYYWGLVASTKLLLWMNLNLDE